ncbi:NtaA/DmoA family FMN-dependent monooxygenase [Conexibacter stalactiti]|uniref:NtaA/DmoA family FMN-dependent monooxygenase n=1 Tax=Conexibacter stalactiti TaxID=1940611 RepID=A0ABU4HLW8_9ACTN|nr:NtaA/DmoA family FMN-dependent monooxygenase [Conexibacter stalactiti]MDW5594279.1 NtaA/DmoA family FMN-dependent monooxygenase [Conexibacter stalactiti]MEC5034921.1 NtaA/DmoA family FMN-dependent monooxygenase [Conexibacter stalactiti]
MSERQLHFNVLVMDAGYHESAWRVVPEPPDSVLHLEHYLEVARVAERGLLDSLFFADVPGIAEFRVEHMPQPHFDPIDLLSAVAARTERIGLIATGSTTFGAPWDLARRFATLDFLSDGRAGWNVVTTALPVAARNFGLERLPDPSERYARAQEFVEVVQRVWDGWEDGAFVGSREQGVWADRGRLHAPRFRGERFEVAGILPFPRSPQGHPLLAQAGASAGGIALAGRYAEVVFAAKPTLEEGAAYRAELRAAAAAAGRDPDHLHVLPGVAFVLGSTEAEARERRAALESIVSSEFRWRNLLNMSGFDPDLLDPDEPLPDELLASRPPTSVAARVFEQARARRVPFRELAESFAVLPGQLEFTGTPEQLAETIARWFEAGAADGFTLLPTTLPHQLGEFADHVVPLLQARGIYRREYEGRTLRDHYGLPRPANANVAPVGVGDA